MRDGVSSVMTFQTPEEATRAVEILTRMAAASERGGITEYDRELASADDRAFLDAHTTAFELRGTAAGEVAGNLGLGFNQGAEQIAGLSGRVAAEHQRGLRIEHRREPPRVTMFSEHTYTGEAGAGLGVGVGGDTDGAHDDAGGRLGVGASGTSRLRMRVEDSYTLPAEMPTIRGASDLLGGVRRFQDYAAEIRASRETTLTLSQDVRGQATGLGSRGTGVEAEITGASEAEVERAMLTARTYGVRAGVESLAGSRARVEARVDDIRTHGFRVNPELSAMGMGIGFTAAAERTDLTTTHVRGDARQVGAQLRAWERQRRGG
jgi:hypothetical protein